MKTIAIPRPTWLIFSLFLLLPFPALAAESGVAPTHTISLSFDLARGMVVGTSRITLPAGIPLILQCGPLEVTGGLLEERNTTPLLVRPDKDNAIRLSAGDQPRSLYLSWQLRTGNRPGSDNMITPQGITLAGFWHPVPDRGMLYTINALLPAGFTGITEASEISEQKRGNQVRFHSTFPHPLAAVHFIAGPYQVRSRKVSDLTLFTYFFPEDAALAGDYLEQASRYIRRYEQLIGPFPYRRYSIVENRLPTGYGMPTFTLLGQAVVRLPFIKDTSLGHEILHSWFGNSIFLKPDSGNWCEGLTTYLADQSYAMDRGKGVQYRKEQLLRYDAYVHADNTMTLAAFRHASDSQPMAKKIRAIGYDKCSMVFHMLEKTIGTKKFRQGLRAFYAEMRWQQAGWNDIERIFTRITGTDLAPFFKQWLTRPEIPRLAIRDIVLDQDRGKSTITFHLLQKTKQPFALQVPVRIRTLTSSVDTVLDTASTDKEYTLQSEELPIELIIDPDYDLMRRLAVEEIPPAWERFAGAADRRVVLPQDGDKAGIYAPLVKYLQENGATTIACAELKNSQLAGADYLFAGRCDVARTLFADPQHPRSGFTLDVRSNPLAPERTMVLVSSGSAAETRAALPKIRHYGKYSYLHFEGGRVRDRRIRPSQNGLVRKLLPPPAGIPVRHVQDFAAIVDDLAESRVVYVGEHHTEYADHLLQLQIIQALHARDPKLAIGMEMFPRSSQQALDRYINGEIRDERAFLKASRYFEVWGYDYRMYRDIIEYARKHAIPLVALNLDKEIVSQVFKSGNTDSLTPEQRATVAAERNLDVPGYRQRLNRARLLHQSAAGKNNLAGFIQAQAMWDETMAESITRYLAAHPDSRMVVIAGSGHVYKDSAIPLRVARRMQVRQSVVIADNGMQDGREQGSRVDYLMFVSPMSLEPAGKIGIMLKTEKTGQEKTSRMRIVGISPHGKAGKAGLEKNDIILAIDGRPVHSMSDLKIGLMGKKPGDHVRLTILRTRPLLPDETLELDVTLSAPQQTTMMLPPGHPGK